MAIQCKSLLALSLILLYAETSCLCMAQLPNAPSSTMPVGGMGYDPNTPKVEVAIVPQQTDDDNLIWKVRPDLPAYVDVAPVKQHNWFYRHPVLIGIIAGSVIGGTIALTHRSGCPKTVSGYSYDGNGHPCPTKCEEDGCYWPSRR